MTDWCILRTSGAKTLPLARSLGDDGFEVWAPVYFIARRVPRQKKWEDHSVPYLPTFVFAEARRISDLLILSKAARSKHPVFSVFRYQARVPVIADSDLEPLREIEERAAGEWKRKKLKDQTPPTFDPGQAVTVTDDAWRGLSGVVERSDGALSLVLFGNISVRISSFLLESEDANEPQSVA